jgi:hypothetical protein
MDDFSMDDIVCNGDFLPESRDTLSILWSITSGCDYRCYYCLAPKSDFGKFSSKDELIKTASKILLLNRPGYQFTLYGGEPTYHPHLLDLIRFLGDTDAPVSLRIFTNGNRHLGFFEKMVNFVKAKPFGFILSIHLEYADINHILQVLEIVAGAGIYVGVNLMFVADHSERGRQFGEALLNLRSKAPFAMSYCFPFTDEGIMGVGLTEDDRQWCHKSTQEFNGFPLPDYYKSPYFTRIRSNIVVEHNGERAMLPPDESLKLLAKPEVPPYKGFYCCGGTNVIFVDEKSNIYSSVCECSKVIGNAINDPLSRLATNMEIVVCGTEGCKSIENIPLPKFRNKVEAEVCLEQYKERGKAYLDRGQKEGKLLFCSQDTITKEQPLLLIDENIKGLCGKSVAIWGTGSCYQKSLVPVIRDANHNITVDCLVDSNQARQGNMMDGYPIISPDELKGRNVDGIIIATCYVDEVLAKLNSLGIQTPQYYIR